MHTVATNWRGRVRKHLPQRFEQIAHAKAEQEGPIVAGEEVAQIVGEVDVRWVGVFVTFDDLVAALLVDGVEKEGVEADGNTPSSRSKPLGSMPFEHFMIWMQNVFNR